MLLEFIELWNGSSFQTVGTAFRPITDFKVNFHNQQVIIIIIIINS